jgi:hypothetical protein
MRERFSSLSPAVLDELGSLLENCLDKGDPELDAAAFLAFARATSA